MRLVKRALIAKYPLVVVLEIIICRLDFNVKKKQVNTVASQNRFRSISGRTSCKDSISTEDN